MYPSGSPFYPYDENCSIVNALFEFVKYED